MKKILVLNKKEGETPLACLGAFRHKHREYESVPMTYAGRLDPMASGVLLVLAGDKVKEKEKYLKLNKEYEFEILFGFATDTHDVLGKVTHSSPPAKGEWLKAEGVKKELQKVLPYFKGEQKQKYPMYSSKTVLGKQLWQHAREGILTEPPEHVVKIKKLDLLGVRRLTNRQLFANFKMRISKVVGDFRQAEIIEEWELALAPAGVYVVARLRMSCTSGTYVRTLAHEIGKKIHIPALAISIKRTKIGKYSSI